MDDPALASSTCPMCEQPLPPGANFCGGCGFALTATPARTGSANPKWYQNIWVMVFLIFFVLGPFAIPLIWKHPKMSPAVKWTLTVLALGYSLLMLALIAKLVAVLQSSLESFNSSLQAF